jgi:hypothetical protein
MAWIRPDERRSLRRLWTFGRGLKGQGGPMLIGSCQPEEFTVSFSAISRSMALACACVVSRMVS